MVRLKALSKAHTMSSTHAREDQKGGGGGGSSNSRAGGSGSGGSRRSVQSVDQLFQAAGLAPSRVSRCLKAGVQHGHLAKALGPGGALDLDAVLFTESCSGCDQEVRRCSFFAPFSRACVL